MKSITLEELNNKKEQLKTLDERLKKISPIIEDLKNEEKVKKYIELDKEFNSLCYKLGELIKEIKYEEMYLCDHYFVTVAKDRYFDGHRTNTDYIYQCIHCGLTNKYLENSYSYDHIMNKVIRNGGVRSYKSHGYCDVKNIKEIKSIYDKFKSEYPEATDDDIEKHISLVKKMKGGF